MKRYLLFAGYDYHADSGGWADFQGQFDSPDLAIASNDINNRFEWWHVVDLAGEPGARIVRKSNAGSWPIEPKRDPA